MAEIQELADSFKQQTNVNLRRNWIAKIQPSFREFGSKPASIKLYEKWLLTDICESSHPCLPQSINTTTQIFTLNNTLQITKIKDISTPGYQQLLKLKDKVSISELENENKYFDKPIRRMYLLELTDGNITINGIECKPVHSLTPNVLPGAKIVLKGMIPVRKGYALLEGNNIEVLGEFKNDFKIRCVTKYFIGGSVDHLVERNSMLALLSRELDLQIATTTTTTAPITTTTIPTGTTTSTRAFQGEAISITDEVKTENNTIDEMSIANDAFLDSVIDEIVDEHLNENFGSLTDFMDEDIEVVINCDFRI